MNQSQKQEIRRITAPANRPIYSIDTSSNSKLLAIGQQSGPNNSATLSMINIQNEDIVYIIEKTKNKTGSVYQVIFNPHKDELFYVLQRSSDFQLKVFNIDGKRSSKVLHEDDPSISTGLSLDSSGKYLIISSDKIIKILETERYKASKTIPLQRIRFDEANDAEFTISSTISPNAKYVAIGGVEEGHVLLYDLEDGSRLRTLNGPFGRASQIRFDRASKYIAAMDFYGHGIFMWEVSTGKRYLEDIFNEDMPLTYSIRFSYANHHFAAGLVNSYVILYDLISGEELLADKFHEGRVTDICFSKDGKLLISAGEDNQICIRYLDERGT